MSRERAVEEYVKRGHRRVEGWLTPLAAEALANLARVQKQLEIRGPVCEVGVHHGKLFILLHLLTNAPEASVAWDLFERQDENVDQSGCGDREVVQRNLQRHGCAAERIRILTENSQNLTPERVIGDCGGRPRIFSIDGGHTAELAYSDLALAERSLCSGGIIIVDDFFNEAWPGVAEGVCRYFAGNSGKLVPIAILGNKVFLTNAPALAKKYMDGVDRRRWGYMRKKSTMFGHAVLIVTPGREQTRRIRNFVAATRVGRWLSANVLSK